jgi:hypothetical protein
MRYALFVPPFDELADPALVASLAADAEEAGWDGFFVWDHITYREPVQALADPWVTLAAVAAATSRIRLGPMVTPLPRRRPVKVARETATLDLLSQGRLVLGVGIGGDRSRELSGTGEQTVDKVRGQMLDEALEVLRAAWSGEPVHHRGEHYLVDGIRSCRHRCSGRGRRSGWPCATATRRRCGEPRGTTASSRSSSRRRTSWLSSPPRSPSSAGASTGFDVLVEGPAGSDPAPYEQAGATWWTGVVPARDEDRRGPRRPAGRPTALTPPTSAPRGAAG